MATTTTAPTLFRFYLKRGDGLLREVIAASSKDACAMAGNDARVIDAFPMKEGCAACTASARAKGDPAVIGFDDGARFFRDDWNGPFGDKSLGTLSLDHVLDVGTDYAYDAGFYAPADIRAYRCAFLRGFKAAHGGFLPPD